MSALLRASLLVLVSTGPCTDSCKLVCGGALVLVHNDNQAKDEERALLDQCGTCAAGTECNVLLSPPACAKMPAPEGSVCGTWFAKKGGRERHYPCGEELSCNHGFEPPKCAKRMPRGGRCWMASDCEEKLWCDSDKRECTGD